MKRFVPLLLLLAACADRAQLIAPPETGPDADSGPHLQGRISREEVEEFSGQRVTAEGRFNHIAGTHASVTLEGGLILYIPHFDRFKEGDAWLKYVGHRVQVGGILHMTNSEIPGQTGPSISIETFATLE